METQIETKWRLQKFKQKYSVSRCKLQIAILDYDRLIRNVGTSTHANAALHSAALKMRNLHYKLRFLNYLFSVPAPPPKNYLSLSADWLKAVLETSVPAVTWRTGCGALIYRSVVIYCVIYGASYVRNPAYAISRTDLWSGP